MKDFILQSISINRFSETGDRVSRDIAQDLVMFVKKCKQLFSKFSTACPQAFIGKKQQSRHWYFHLFEYSAIFFPRGKKAGIKLGQLKIKQMKRAYQKLYKTFDNGQKELSWQKICIFYELSSNGHSNLNLSTCRKPTIEFSSLSEEAWLTFKKFRKIDSYHLDETSLSALIRLDAITTDVLYNLLQCICYLESIVKQKPSFDIQENSDDADIHLLKRKRTCTRNGSFSQCSSVRLNFLLL